MSLYNMIFGMNPNKDLILALIGLKKCDVERFRDCGIDFNSKQIYIYTRTGGGNREDYPNDLLINSPYYLSDEDDDYDCTYATYYFKFPDEIADDIENLSNTSVNGVSGKLITWVNNVVNRQKTEGDIYTENYEEQVRLLKEIADPSYGQINYVTFNGHTIIPLNDSAMGRLLSVAEKAEGNFYPYTISPYQIIVSENCKQWKGLKDDSMCLLKIDTNWKVDTNSWDRYKKKFGEKYPKSISNIEKRISKIS